MSKVLSVAEVKIPLPLNSVLNFLLVLKSNSYFERLGQMHLLIDYQLLRSPVINHRVYANEYGTDLYSPLVLS